MKNWPIAIIEDRYGGTYSGGTWLAIAKADSLENGIPRIAEVLVGGPHGGDTDAMMFWVDPPEWIAVGDTPNEALGALKAKS